MNINFQKVQHRRHYLQLSYSPSDRVIRAGLFLISYFLFTSCHSTKNNTMNTASNATSNTSPAMLSQQEKNEGWQLLFDGHTTNGWHGYGRPTFPKVWKAEDGALHLDGASKKSYTTNEGGDIVTDEDFDNFDLKLEWKISKKGNSGIIFYVKEDSSKYKQSYNTGPEMQVLDNTGHPDAQIYKHKAGDLYDLIASSKQAEKPVGEWNQVEIVANKGKLDFYLNGEHTINTTMWDDNWRNMIANSKFATMPDFGTFKSGKIDLQDHGDDVWFRNIKIKKL
jgi:Domain of Unknown Function (DUF1080)